MLASEEGSGARASGRCGPQPTRPYHPGVIPTRPTEPASPSPRCASDACLRGWRTRAADRRRRGIPRPAGSRAARERPARSQRPLDLSDRRPDRGARGAGRRPGSVRRRAAPRCAGWTRRLPDEPDAPPFIGGLVGFLGYDLGHVLERLPSIAIDDQGLPPLRLALHDWVVAWDRRTGEAWLARPGGRR